VWFTSAIHPPLTEVGVFLQENDKVEPVDLVFYSETLSMPPDNKAIKAVVNFDAFFSKIDGFIVASKSMCFKVSKHQDQKVVSLPFDSKELSATLG